MPCSPRFREKYRIETNRLKGWDYATPGYYFVTICAKYRTPWFGHVTEKGIVLSAIGEIVEQELVKTPRIRSHVSPDTYVVMPNHIHLVIVIGQVDENTVETPRRGVSTTKKWRSGTLGAIVNQFKSICTKRIHSAGSKDFSWQSRFYDHIIMNEKELGNIRAYIQGNPFKWNEDENYLSCDQ